MHRSLLEFVQTFSGAVELKIFLTISVIICIEIGSSLCRTHYLTPMLMMLMSWLVCIWKTEKVALAGRKFECQTELIGFSVAVARFSPSFSNYTISQVVCQLKSCLQRSQRLELAHTKMMKSRKKWKSGGKTWKRKLEKSSEILWTYTRDDIESSQV